MRAEATKGRNAMILEKRKSKAMKMSKCERCGKTWEYSPLQNVSFPIVYLGIGIEADLCSECRKDLLKWLNGNEKTGENGTPMTDEAVQMVMERLEAAGRQI